MFVLKFAYLTTPPSFEVTISGDSLRDLTSPEALRCADEFAVQHGCQLHSLAAIDSPIIENGQRCRRFRYAHRPALGLDRADVYQMLGDQALTIVHSLTREHQVLEALQEFGQHRSWCGSLPLLPRTCDCGFAGAQDLAAAASPEDGGGSRDILFRTSSGRLLNFACVSVDDLLVEDVAHGLSNVCRFGGQSRQFLSVAQHSVLVSRLCSQEHALAGLLHDAAEAYLLAVPSPLKHHSVMAGYRLLEQRLMAVIAQRFGFAFPLPPEVKFADLAVREAEQRDVCNTPTVHSSSLPTIEPLLPCEAKQLFLSRLSELTEAVA